jgi:hypothetical protein
LGNPNAQPPTPTQTPTSGVFSSPAFQTPRAEAPTFDEHTGWTPTFAEEYSVFNATPGRLTSTGTHFTDISTPRPSTASSQKGPLSNTSELEAELASHVHHSIQTDLLLPPVDPSRRLPSSPRDFSLHGTVSGDKKSLTTPRKPRRRLEEAFSGQTATPPQSATKSPRKLAPKPQTGTMQADQDQLQMSSGTPGLPNHLNFSTGPDDMFAYSMTAPATAPIYTNTKCFWDPDSSMSGMDMDLDFSAGGNAMFDPAMSHRVSNSVDWARSNQMFQDTVNMQVFNEDVVQASRRQRPIASKDQMSSAAPNISNSNFSFGGSTMSEDPFAVVASSGAVDPGLLFTFPDLTSSNITGPELDSPVQSYSQPATSQVVRKPYQHQQRESIRDQEELRRSRSSKETSTAVRHEKTSFSSPAKKIGRPGLQRSASDSRTKVGQSRRPGQLSTIAPRPSTAEVRENPIRRRTSPLKHQSRTSLSSIPESVSGTRTSLTFSIDANGRARTETKIIVEEPMTIKRRPSSPISDDWASSQHSDSSTDEDPIILPSRNTSFSLPPRRPKLGHFDNSRESIEGRRQSIEEPQRSFNASDAFSRKLELDEQESEAETVMDDYDGSGDATAALRKVMESRKQGAMHQGSFQHHFNPSSLNRGTSASHTTPRKNNPQYHNSTSSTNLSPTTVSDPDLATPSTDRESSRSDSTRCICNNRDGDGFMIQWYVA